MADMKKVYNDLTIINLYIFRRFTFPKIKYVKFICIFQEGF